MAEISYTLEQKFICTAKECEREFTSIDDWRIHVENYSFDAGHICLYDSCGEFISANSNKPLTLQSHRSHLYLKHHVEQCRTEELRKAFIDQNLCCVAEGRMWCSRRHGLLELGDRAVVYDHFQEHNRNGSQFKVPGQTKYSDTNRARKEVVERSAESANEGDYYVIDLARRGTIVWIPPAERKGVL